LRIVEHSTSPLGDDDEEEEEDNEEEHNRRVFHALPQYANLLFNRVWMFHENRKEMTTS
jgi:hypothetical protein